MAAILDFLVENHLIGDISSMNGDIELKLHMNIGHNLRMALNDSGLPLFESWGSHLGFSCEKSHNLSYLNNKGEY